MKKMMTLAVMMTIAISAAAMTYNEARSEALFLSDKMAYELDLTEAQYEAVYEINLDDLMSVNSRYDINGPWWDRRNADLRHVLAAWQYDRFLRLSMGVPHPQPLCQQGVLLQTASRSVPVVQGWLQPHACWLLRRP